MANRFVWSRYAATPKYNVIREDVEGTPFAACQGTTAWMIRGTSYTLDNGSFVIDAPEYVQIYNGYSFDIEIGERVYFCTAPMRINRFSQLYDVYSAAGSEMTVSFATQSGFIYATSRGSWGSVDELTSEQDGYEKGTLQGYASSATDGQYPQDGVSGNSYVSAHPLPLSRPIPRRKIHQYQAIQGIVLAVSYGEGFGHFDETAT